jgi:hypothetical protein
LVKTEKQAKNFHEKEKLKQIMTTKPGLQKIVKGILHSEEEDKGNYKNKGKYKSHYWSSAVRDN